MPDPRIIASFFASNERTDPMISATSELAWIAAEEQGSRPSRWIRSCSRIMRCHYHGAAFVAVPASSRYIPLVLRPSIFIPPCEPTLRDRLPKGEG